MGGSLKTLLEPSIDVQVSLFDGADYVDWREVVKKQLKSKGAHVWDDVESKKWYLKKKTRMSKDDQRFNSIALQTIKKALSNDVKIKIGLCTVARNLWLKLEEAYQAKYQRPKEDNNKKSNEERREDLKDDEEINGTSIYNTSISENSHDEGDDLIENTGLELHEQSDCGSHDDIGIFKEKWENLSIIKNQVTITKHEDLKKLKEDFLTTIKDAKKKLSFSLKNVFDKIENKFMVTLSELETVFKINELLQGVWIESKSSKSQNNHQVETEEEVKRLKSKVLDLTRRYEGKLREK